jgi:ABC-type multidrug transport system fused ATPase/permease subunit
VCRIRGILSNNASIAAFHELFPLTVGGAALMISSYSNQALPILMGQLLDPASSRANNKGSSFAASITWVALVGGTASFLRTLMLNQAQESIAARLRKAAFASLMTRHDLEWFQVEDAEHGGKSLVVEPEESNDLTESTTPSTSLGMTPGAIAVIIKDDAEAVANTMTTTLANLVRSSSSVIFSSFNMILLNPNLFGLSLAVAPAVGSIA